LKFKFLFIVFTLSLFLGSCAKAPAKYSDPLLYQSYPFSIEGKITVDNAKYDISANITSDTDMKITISSGILKNVSLIFNEEGYRLIYEDFEIPVNKHCGGIFLSRKMFCLKPDQFVSASVEELGNEKINIVSFRLNDADTVNVHLKNDGTPFKIEGILSQEVITVDISSFSAENDYSE